MSDKKPRPQINPADMPFYTFGEGDPVIHFSHANGYPALCYSDMLSEIGEVLPIIASDHRPSWDKQTSATELTTWQLFADDLIAFLDHHKLSNIVGVGHSLGAIATMYAAIRRPDLFRALVLIEPVLLDANILKLASKFPNVNPKLVPRGKVALRRTDQWNSRAEVFESYRTKKVFSRMPDKSLRNFVSHGLVENQEGVTLKFPKVWEAYIYSRPPINAWEAVAELTHPTLALRGAATDLITNENWEKWQSLQPEATFIELQNSGHMLPLEIASKVSQEIIKFSLSNQ